MALQYQLSTDEQIWVMIRVKQGLLSMDEALEYVRKQHEAAGLPPVVAPCHMYTSPRSPSSSPRPTRAHSHNSSQTSLITEKLQKKGCTVINASGDADVDIIKAAIKASQHQPTTLIGEDTDLLILLLHYAETPNNKGLYFRSDKSTVPKVYDIIETKQALGNDLCSQLLFIHAFTGCDTTSRIGKKSVFQKLANGESTIQTCATNNVIEDLGSKAMAVMFGGKSTDSLASLRYNLVSSKSFVTPERLPPTEST